MTQPAAQTAVESGEGEAVLVPFTDVNEALPDRRDTGPLGFREATAEELAEMEGDDPGTGMTEAEIDAFLGREIADAAVAEEAVAMGPSDQPEEA